MSLPIKLISTDFDGTLFAEFENPPVPVKLQNLIGDLQRQGAKWVINTGRDLSSLMETMGRSHLSVKPDFLVIVEREIYVHRNQEYVASAEWNAACATAHGELFRKVHEDSPRLMAWVEERFKASVYADAYSPFCLIAERNEDADVIHDYLNEYCREVPNLTVVRNDVYARFSHAAFNKGTALAEIGRQTGIGAESILAAGDHLNDLPMLTRKHARWLVAPENAIETVKTTVRSEGGYVSHLSRGHGVADGLEFCLRKAESSMTAR